jgi:hypothetical protein
MNSVPSCYSDYYSAFHVVQYFACVCSDSSCYSVPTRYVAALRVLWFASGATYKQGCVDFVECDYVVTDAYAVRGVCRRGQSSHVLHGHALRVCERDQRIRKKMNYER